MLISHAKQKPRFAFVSMVLKMGTFSSNGEPCNKACVSVDLILCTKKAHHCQLMCVCIVCVCVCALITSKVRVNLLILHVQMLYCEYIRIVCSSVHCSFPIPLFKFLPVTFFLLLSPMQLKCVICICVTALVITILIAIAVSIIVVVFTAFNPLSSDSSTIPPVFSPQNEGSGMYTALP